MPIYLPPLSRRRFLRETLLAGAALGLAPRGWTAATAADPDSWALLADVHIHGDRATISRGVNMAGNLSAVARELAGLPRRCAGVLIVGDCAQESGQSPDYATLRDLVRPIREAQMPVHLALGNHDNRERFWAALPEENAAGHPVPNYQTAWLPAVRANWFVLDSLETTLAVPGLLGPAQLEWLARSLDENPDRPAIVVVHHNPHDPRGVPGVKDTAELFQVIRPRRQVKAYVFGHTHDWQVTRDESGIHLINLPPVAYVFAAGKPSGWIHATLRDDGARLEMRCIDPAHPAHGHVTDLAWRT
jgi:Icc protein